ncbi:sulfatase-like hydrolase/transferase [Actinocatenispora rupis]|uniref:Acetylglucosamine-6-sulfatase n=1 Tax=Actinocatenispora rupis TaxID=519421 RepID=A0A8J3JAX3_9ACTN|nr:sulfatase-like hydrolase/transferase [Actinocatenispora rupis]GID15085.1 acetylglucosamine-6-sulfatase [Actinocatenispora rupis]
MPHNVLFLMTDQHRTDAIGCYGNPHARTPNLDGLAESGTLFRNAFTPTAICTPARASLLTGQAPFRHRLLANAEWNTGYLTELPEGTPTFSEALRGNGYNVGLIGKWHVGERLGPDAYGFDGPHLPGAMNPILAKEYKAWLAERGLPEPAITDPVRGTLPGGRPGHLLAGRLRQPVEATFEHFLADQAIDLLRRYAADGRPFHLSLHFFGPHLPYLIPDEYYDLVDPATVELPASFAETFAGKPEVQRNYSTYWSADSFDADEWRKLIAVYHGYGAMIDAEIGRVLAVLTELGLDDDTAVFFTADHGEFTGAHRLNDKGPAMYDDIYRIPFLLRVPGAAAGRTDERFVTLTDATATILDLAGLDPDLCPDARPAGCPPDGRSLLPLVRDEPVDGWRSELVAEFHGHHFHYQQRMLRDERYKLVVNAESVNELYDLVADPYELVNVYPAPHLAPVRRDMLRRLHTALTERGDDVFARWMLAISDLDVPLANSSRSDFGSLE